MQLKKDLEVFSGKLVCRVEESFQEETAKLFTNGNGSDLANGLDYLLNQDLRPLLADLPVSPVIIQGDQDRIVPSEQARFLHENLPGSSLHLLPGAGHLPFWTEAELFNRILVEVIVGRGPGNVEQAPSPAQETAEGGCSTFPLPKHPG